MKKVLIAYDGSPCSEAMLEDLSRAGLPGELNATVVTIADVWLPRDPKLSEPAFPNAVSKAVRKAYATARQEIESRRGTVERAGERLKQLFPKWKVRAKTFADSPAWGIIKEAATCKADLIVVGSLGRSPLKKFFLGSVAQKVAAEAHDSVRIARPRQDLKRSPVKILVAVDGSADSQAAVHAVAMRNWPLASQFSVVTVVDPKLETAVTWPSVYADQWVHPDDRYANEWVCRMSEHSAQHLRDAGLKVEIHVFDGDPKEVLLREAKTWAADCIFLGARGLHHGDRLFLGSLASAVAARAHCSVEIVRMK